MAWFLYRTPIESKTLVSHPSDIISHSLHSCDMMSEYGAIRCTEGCDTSVSDSIRVRYKNHVMMFYLSLNYSIAVLAYGVFISTQYEIQNIFNKTVFGCNLDNTTFYIRQI